MRAVALRRVPRDAIRQVLLSFTPSCNLYGSTPLAPLVIVQTTTSHHNSGMRQHKHLYVLRNCDVGIDVARCVRDAPTDV
jgi:hypothetical protein